MVSSSRSSSAGSSRSSKCIVSASTRAYRSRSSLVIVDPNNLAPLPRKSGKRYVEENNMVIYYHSSSRKADLDRHMKSALSAKYPIQYHVRGNENDESVEDHVRDYARCHENDEGGGDWPAMEDKDHFRRHENDEDGDDSPAMYDKDHYRDFSRGNENDEKMTVDARFRSENDGVMSELGSKSYW